MDLVIEPCGRLRATRRRRAAAADEADAAAVAAAPARALVLRMAALDARPAAVALAEALLARAVAVAVGGAPVTIMTNFHYVSDEFPLSRNQAYARRD